MKRLRLHLELNRGRHGMPLAKLAALQLDLLAFLSSLSSDLHLPIADDLWLADNFKNGSLLYDVEASIDLDEYPLSLAQDTVEALLAGRPNDLTVSLNAKTQARFDKIWLHLDADEIARIGVYRTQSEPSLFELRRSSSPQLVGGLIDRGEYGEIQGEVHSLIKGVKEPYIVIRELSTNEKVNCFFKKPQYKAIVDLLEDQQAIVFVEGWLRLDPETQFVKRVQVEEFRPAPDFSLDAYKRMLGSMPDYVVEQLDEDVA